MKRQLPLLVLPAVLPIVMLGLAAAPATAAVVSLTAPPRATIGAATVVVPVTVDVDAGRDGHHRASVWYRYPDDKALTRVARLDTRRSGAVVVKARLVAARLAYGLNRLTVTDDSLDAATSQPGAPTVAVDARRRSRAQLAVTPSATGKSVTLAVRVTHYDPVKGRYRASRLSPVRLQQFFRGAWVTQATVTTDVDGLASATVPETAGAARYRAYRPDGATVWSALSPAVTVTDPD